MGRGVSNMEECQTCGSEAGWTWYTGKGAVGRYCDEHAKEELPKERELDSFKDAITTGRDLNDSSHSVVIPGGGVMPLGERLPVIRAIEPFEKYVTS